MCHVLPRITSPYLLRGWITAARWPTTEDPGGWADSPIEESRQEVERLLASAAHDGVREIDMLQQELHDDLAAFVYDQLRRRPMVLPVVVEV